MDEIEIERYDTEYIADKFEDTIPEIMDYLKTRSAIVESCAYLIDSLSQLVAEPLPKKQMQQILKKCSS